MRRTAFRSGILASMAGFAVIASCSSYDEETRNDAGADAAALPPPIDATSPRLDGPGEAVPDAAFDGAPGDAGHDSAVDADSCSQCRSKHCQSDGGCDPLVFVTAATFRGDLDPVLVGQGGLARGDALCMQNAEGAGTFRAWLSSGNDSAKKRIVESSAANRPVWLADGTLIAESYERIVASASLLRPIARTAAGAALPLATTIKVWTGTDANGSVAGSTCQAFTSGDNAQQGVQGNATLSDKDWTSGAATKCNDTAHLYCFEIVR